MNAEWTSSESFLGDLTLVSQGCPGCQQRSFQYDSLRRLGQATNPESGTVNYAYDSAGNLTWRQDNRGIQTSYIYDALNRITQKTYSDYTPQALYSYDAGNVAYSKGRLTQVNNQWVIENYTAYDALGRVVGSNEQTWGQTYPFSYSYNLAGSVTGETYPSGRIVNTNYDNANRPFAVEGWLGGVQTNYVTQSSYAPQGAPELQWYGNKVVPNWFYNSRLQPMDVYATVNNDPNNWLFVETLDWGGGNNNGNLRGLGEYVGNSVTAAEERYYGEAFSYDGVNRLTTAIDADNTCGGWCWSRSFQYDPFGNMWVSSNTGVPLAGNTPTSNLYNSANQMSGQTYDAAGNQLSVNGNTAGYDAENRMIALTEAPAFGGGTETYGYGGSGRRNLKVAPDGTVTAYVYDVFGQSAAEYSSTPASSPCQTCYYTYDHLGNVRMVTDQSANVIARHDFLPFGEEIAGWADRSSDLYFGFSDNVTQRFTGKERDAESGLDYFGARYYGSALGRFTSPDPLLNSAKPWDPQSWNRYAYALNNPLAVTDPTGLYNLVNTCDSGNKNCNKQFQQHARDLKSGLSDLQKRVDKMKDGPEKQRLQASLKALGTENDGNNVGVKFGTLPGTASGHTDVNVDDKTGAIKGFTVTFDPNPEKMPNGTNDYAVDAAHEGTHVTNISDPRYAAGQLSDFSDEYRAYQTSGWAAQALGMPNLSFGRNEIWNSSWATVDRQTLSDKGITKEVTGPPYNYKETQPHNPWPN